MTLLGIDHVGIAIRGDDSAAATAVQTFSRLLGGPATEPKTLAAQGVQVCFIPLASPNLELLTPIDQSGAVARFLAHRGEGLHHVCFAVDDIAFELRRLEAAGFELIDRTPRDGHGGLVAFVHPRSAHGVLIELLERRP